ncbi:hypothetical protein Hanom_Chr04g00344541 [Helianthus anomalus]
MERSPPKSLSPLVSSQKDQVVSTATPHYEAMESLDSIFHGPFPRAMSLSTPQASPITLPPTILPLLKEIDIDQTHISSSHTPIHESSPLHVTESEHTSLANPSTAEDATPHDLHVTFGGSSSEAATTNVETSVSHLDRGYIPKTSLKATIVEATTVTTVPVGGPQYQDKGASDIDDMGFISMEIPDTTTTGGSSDDLIKLGDELRYKEYRENESHGIISGCCQIHGETNVTTLSITSTYTNHC